MLGSIQRLLQAATARVASVLKREPPAGTRGPSAGKSSSGLAGLGADRFDRAGASRGPSDKAYAVRTDPEGKATVRFGDGEAGRRLPVGTQGVEAGYRAGSGAAGALPAEVEIDPRRRAGHLEVQQPTPSAGGSEAEPPEETREAAPGSASERSSFFSGQLLGAEDLAGEQEDDAPPGSTQERLSFFSGRLLDAKDLQEEQESRRPKKKLDD